jgi:hypothetical protein
MLFFFDILRMGTTSSSFYCKQKVGGLGYGKVGVKSM